MNNKKTTLETLIDELFNSLSTYETSDTCSCHCDDCYCKDDDDDEVKEDDDDDTTLYSPDYEVLGYTDEDFKDDAKYYKYLDEVEKLIDAYNNMSSGMQKLLEAVLKCDDLTGMMKDKMNHAIAVHNASKPKSTTTTELADRYVDEVFVPSFTELGGEITSKQIVAMKRQFGAFADWILAQ